MPRRTGAAGSGKAGLRFIRLVALAAIVVAGLFLGCTFFSAKEPPAPPPPAVMPMTPAAVSDCLSRVQTAKAAQPRPESLDDFVRYVAAAYVEPVRSRYAVAETMETAVRLSAAGNAQAQRFLAATVRDVQLQAAMGGRTFSVDQWREIYLRSGLLNQDTFVAIGGELPQPETGRPAASVAPAPDAAVSGPSLPPLSEDEGE
ncbi:hypothetical protein G3N56_06450 [Desulfovibrio sulfodismutans]|uniref:Lipoprotein n=1 Tax=Desulfolutivibrio sulfodismutans TaxID=63561 RepID=A0A7K3NKN6_9BACT|nr:hypothetical protein [Desulfolutivibrio sulfodismutans]NDY56383.1 hypothetical protein [Desulfolutivibrio sulfodismutans]QLA13447.1 hypothetical protein GD606_14835 [Desulfolutivibrio sulfodismutans DSM 3696]